MSTCVKPLATYTCSNASGTTCTKVSATVYVLSTNTTCPAGEFALLTSAQETAISTATTNVTSQQSSITALNAAVVALQGGGGYSVNADVITAETTIFGIVLAAAAVIWGVKQVYHTLTARIAHE